MSCRLSPTCLVRRPGSRISTLTTTSSAPDVMQRWSGILSSFYGNVSKHSSHRRLSRSLELHPCIRSHGILYLLPGFISGVALLLLGYSSKKQGNPHFPAPDALSWIDAELGNYIDDNGPFTQDSFDEYCDRELWDVDWNRIEFTVTGTWLRGVTRLLPPEVKTVHPPDPFLDINTLEDRSWDLGTVVYGLMIRALVSGTGFTVTGTSFLPDSFCLTLRNISRVFFTHHFWLPRIQKCTWNSRYLLRDSIRAYPRDSLWQEDRLNGFNTLLFNICGEDGASFICILVNNLTEHENRMVFYNLEGI